jgi:hypothetical protein
MEGVSVWDYERLVRKIYNAGFLNTNIWQGQPECGLHYKREVIHTNAE